MTVEADVRALLGDGAESSRVETCIRLAEAAVLGRFRRYAPKISVRPSALDYVVVEIAVARYNRIGAEGMSSEGVDGYSSSYQADLLAPYDVAIREAAEEGMSLERSGRVRFL